MTQTLLDKRRYDVLNAVSLKKMATAAAVSEIVDLGTDQVRDILAELAEGEGLPASLMDRLKTVRIAMAGGFDSLNVAAASAIALHQFSRYSRQAPLTRSE